MAREIDKENTETFQKRHIRIGIEGTIGSGKTTLLDAFRRIIPDACFVDEEFEGNPYLPMVSSDPQRYAFRSQIFQLRKKIGSFTKIPTDRPVFLVPLDEDLAHEAAHHELGNISDKDHESYSALVDLFDELGMIVKPDVKLHLKIDADTLLNWIENRGRDFEEGIDKTFLETHIKWLIEIDRSSGIPVVDVSTGTHDFTGDIKKDSDAWNELSRIGSRINSDLRSKQGAWPSHLLPFDYPIKGEAQLVDLPPSTSAESRRLFGT